jgi:transposase
MIVIPLDEKLKKQKVQLISPHRQSRKRKTTQDDQTLSKYCKRWKVERLFAWVFHFRKCVTRYEYKPENYLGFIQLACLIILTRRF